MPTTAAPTFEQNLLFEPATSIRPEAHCAVYQDATGQPAGRLHASSDATLAFIVAQRRVQDTAAAHELRAVVEWADRHRVDTTDEVGAVDRDVVGLIDHHFGSLDAGLERDLRLAGQGTFTVAEFAVTPVAVALGMSETAARRYLGQGIELRDRLPRLWEQVMTGALPAWKARQVATETIPLNAAGSAYVDRHLAPFAATISLWRVLKAVQAAVLRHDPALADHRAREAAEGRGVWLEDRIDGTTSITAVTGTPDAVAFDTAVNDVAASLGALGDDDTHDVRRAKAIGVLADPQYALDLAATHQAAAEAGEPGRLPNRSSGTGPVIHVHLHTSALTETSVFAGSRQARPAEAASRPAGGAVARVDRFGPRSLEAIERWLADLMPGATIKVTPVIDTTEIISVDAYELPDRLHRQVEERDSCCQFPWCGRTGPFDVDHIEPFVSPDDGGPPGQTNSSNLARLCRYHHRVKTFGGWRYRREPDTSLTWTSPFDDRYRVDPTGTIAQS